MESLYIKNFKNLTDLSLEGLKKVNLIVGRNNVGKSSLLEALSIYLSNGSEDSLRDVLACMGEDYATPASLDGNMDANKMMTVQYSALFNGRNMSFTEANFFSIGEREDALTFRFVRIGERPSADKNGKLNSDMMIYTDDATDLPATMEYMGDGLAVFDSSKPVNVIRFTSRGMPRNVKDKCRFEYVLTRDFMLRRNVTLFDSIALSDKEQYVLEALRIIEPDIDRLNFLNESAFSNKRIPFVTLKSTGERLRLTSMGDGINRIMTVILALVNCKNGVFLLDEFENGLHYTVQQQLWQMIFRLADMLNIQVFATSHSRDCIDSFVSANNGGKGQIIRLDKRGDNVVAVNYDDENEMQFITEHGIEIR